MSNVKYMEMEDIAYKEWSDHLDFVASSRASPWLPTYGYHPPSPIQEIFQTQPDPFLSDNSSGNQQQYLVLETIVEETSDDLCSESDKSGPTGWNSDSDTDSVIHLPKSSGNVIAESWRTHDRTEEVPKKRRRRFLDKYSVSDDDEPLDNTESNSLSSRSSSLIAFESLEKHCEDGLASHGSVDPFGFGANVHRSRWTASPDSPRESLDEFDSSDEEPGFGSSLDTLHRPRALRSTLRPSPSSDSRIKSYRSFDSLNLFESSPPVSFTLAELSQSQNALDVEKEKEQEQGFVIRDKKLTATTADLSRMTDPYDTGLKGLGSRPRRRRDVASFHYKDPSPFRHLPSSGPDDLKPSRTYFPSRRKSYSTEGLKNSPSQAEDISVGGGVGVGVDVDVDDDDGHGRSDPCLNLPPKPHHSVENLSEDSGFDDHISARTKVNRLNFRASVSSIPEDEDASPLESSSSNFSDCNGSEGSVVSTEGREQFKNSSKNIGSSKITNGIESETEARGSLGIRDDANVKYNPGQSQAHMFNCIGGEVIEEPFAREEVEKLVATPVPFASLASHESVSTRQEATSASDEPTEKTVNLSNFGTCETKCFTTKGDLTASKSLDDFDPDAMNGKANVRQRVDVGRAKPPRHSVLSTPNLLFDAEDLARAVPSAASSLTHVPLKCYDEDDVDGQPTSNFFGLSGNPLESPFGGSQTGGSTKGVHFCPVVSEVSWQDTYSEGSSNESNASSDTSTDELSNRSLEELCGMQDVDDDDEDYHEVEEKSIPRERHVLGSNADASKRSDAGQQGVPLMKFKSVSEQNLSSSNREPMYPHLGQTKGSRPSDKTTGPTSRGKDGGNFGPDASSNGCESNTNEKRVTPTIYVTPTSSGHVLVSDAAQSNAERRPQWLSVSESNLPTQANNVSDDDTFASSGRVYSDNAASASTTDSTAKDGMTMSKKSKSRFGGFFERFSLRRLSNRKSSGGQGKKPNGKKDDRGGSGPGVGGGAVCLPEDVTIIPLHGPDSEARVNEIFRSVVTPHVVSAKPPLPPGFQRMSGGPRKHFPAGTVSVGLQDAEADGRRHKNMPGVRENGSDDRAQSTGNGSAVNLSDGGNVRSDGGNVVGDKPVGLLETDLDTHITVESAGRRPLGQCNVGNGKKARSLMNLGLGEMSVHHDQQQNMPSGYLEPASHRSHGSVAVDDRAKSMEFLLDKENQAAVLPPENELQKGGTGERVMSEHQLRVQRSLQKLNIPDWYKSSAVSQTPQGFLLKRNSESRKEYQGWPGLGSKTTSLSSLGSTQSATTKSPTSHILSPSPTPHMFTRWSTSRLSSGLNSSSTSPSASLRSSFNYRQPYLGWRSQERLTRPRTPAERLAAGLLPLQKQHTSAQSNSQSSVNLSDVRTSIKEVTSAIVHYVSGVQENGSKEALRSYQPGISPSPSPKRQSSPRGSSGKLCWLESSFVGSKPLEQPETPLSLTEPSSIRPDPRTNNLYLDLTPHSDANHLSCHRLNEGTPAVVSVTTEEEESFEKPFEVVKRPSPTSATLDDILDSLLGLPPTSRSPSPGSLSAATAAAFSPGRSRPVLPLPDRQRQRQSCGDIRANASESASDPGDANFAREVMMSRRKSDGGTGEIGGDHRTGSSEHKSKRSGEGGRSGREELSRAQIAESIVKCRYSKCGKTATVMDAKKTFKTCHNCSHVYCSRECRRAHWERHRRTCLHSRVGALCRQVLTAAKEDAKALQHLSMLARRGYLTHGRGAVKIFFSSPELAEKFVARGFEEMGEPAYVKWSDLLPAEMGADLFAELVKICKSYNPDTRLVLYVAVCVVSEVPTTGAVKWERQLVSRCCKLSLDKSLAPGREDKLDVPPPLPPRKSSSECVKITREMENPDTLILTSLPGTAGQMPEQKVREISFVNIQRELKQRGVSLRRQFPEVYKKLCLYVEGSSEHFTPVTIYPRDVISGKTFMCIIMPDSEPEKLELVPKDSVRVQTIDVSIERKSS